MLRNRRGQPRSLSGRVVAITGGARGIGHATARALAHQGARVANGELAAGVASELVGHAFGVGVDVTDSAAFTAFLDGVEHRLGSLEVLVNNAGIMSAGAIEDEDEAITARAIAINLEAVIHGTREAVRRMKPRRTGHVVNVSSAVSKVAGSHCATYVATKFGVAGFSEAVAIELRGSGVDMSVVRPSLCHTDLTSGFAGLRGMPFIEPEDVARRIVETLQRPRFDVPVPKSMGPMLWLNQALPFRARVALARVTGADAVLSGIDHGQGAGYAARLERIAAAASEPSADLASAHTTGKE